MRDITKLNIWKSEEKRNLSNDMFLNTEIAALNLSVRSYNCLKRANCHTVGDILDCIGEDGQGLRKIRNLGSRSETEIMEKISEYRVLCKAQEPAAEKKKSAIIKPAKKIWDRGIDEFHLSETSFAKLRSCGIEKIGDLYEKNMKREPGWYAVRELFEKVPSCR